METPGLDRVLYLCQQGSLTYFDSGTQCHERRIKLEPIVLAASHRVGLP